MNKREWVRLVRDGVDLDAVSEAAGVPVRVDGWRFVFGDVGWLARLVTTSVSRGGKVYLTARIIVLASRDSALALSVYRRLGASVDRPHHSEFIDVANGPVLGMRRVEELLSVDAAPWLDDHASFGAVERVIKGQLARGVLLGVGSEILAAVSALRLDRSGIGCNLDDLRALLANEPSSEGLVSRRDWIEELVEADDAELEEMLRDAARSAVKRLRLSKVDVDAFPFPITD